MFIELTAAFRNEDQPNFEELGIKVSSEDMQNAFWDSLWIEYRSIVTMNVNSDGDTNISLLDGNVWTVKEDPRQINQMCKEVDES